MQQLLLHGPEGQVRRKQQLGVAKPMCNERRWSECCKERETARSLSLLCPHHDSTNVTTHAPLACLAYSILDLPPAFLARLNSASAMAHDEKHCLKQCEVLHALVSDNTCQLFYCISRQTKAHHTQHRDSGSAQSSTHGNKSPVPELTLVLVTQHKLQFML